MKKKPQQVIVVKEKYEIYLCIIIHVYVDLHVYVYEDLQVKILI